jgi:hypothetical protein
VAEPSAPLTDDEFDDIRDTLTGWVSPQNKIQCDCGSKSPTYPTYRAEFHVAPCPWLYVARLAAEVERLRNAIEGKDAELDRLAAAVRGMSTCEFCGSIGPSTWLEKIPTGPPAMVCPNCARDFWAPKQQAAVREGEAREALAAGSSEGAE